MGEVGMSGEHYDVAAVRQASNIVRVIGEHVRLRPVGGSARWTGRCPFHEEKTPSFSVNEAKQFFKCFGCGAGGDVITFVMRIHGFTFPETVKMLGEMAGIPPAGNWSPEERRRYAKAAAEAPELGQRLADLARGIQL